MKTKKNDLSFGTVNQRHAMLISRKMYDEKSFGAIQQGCT